MFRQRLDFTPDESALKYQRERDEYIKRLKNFQSASALAPVQPEPSVSEAVAEVEMRKEAGLFRHGCGAYRSFDFDALRGRRRAGQRAFGNTYIFNVVKKYPKGEKSLFGYCFL